MLGYAIGVMLSCFDEWQRRRTAERQKYREALAAGGAAVASISGELSRAIMGSAARIMLWVSLGATFFGLVEGRDWVDAVTLTTNPHPSPGPNPGPNPDPILRYAMLHYTTVYYTPLHYTRPPSAP